LRDVRKTKFIYFQQLVGEKKFYERDEDRKYAVDGRQGKLHNSWIGDGGEGDIRDSKLCSPIVDAPDVSIWGGGKDTLIPNSRSPHKIMVNHIIRGSGGSCHSGIYRKAMSSLSLQKEEDEVANSDGLKKSKYSSPNVGFLKWGGQDVEGRSVV